MGVIIAVLRGDGTEPEVREECIMSMMRGAREGRQSLTRDVGSGSSLEVDDLDFWMKDIISLMVGNVKEESEDGGGGVGKRQYLQSKEEQGGDNC